SVEQVERFHQNLLGKPTLRVRPTIRQDDELPLELRYPLRAPTGLPVTVTIRCEGDDPVTQGVIAPQRATVGGGGGWSPVYYPFHSRPGALKPGQYHLRLKSRAVVAVGRFSGAIPTGVAAVAETLEADIEVLSGARDSVEIVNGADVDS